jgi:hypothetical protein
VFFYKVQRLRQRIVESQMKDVRKLGAEQEPVGIVISSGSREEESPRFAAYVWGPVPEDEVAEVSEMAAA